MNPSGIWAASPSWRAKAGKLYRGYCPISPIVLLARYLERPSKQLAAARASGLQRHYAGTLQGATEMHRKAEHFNTFNTCIRCILEWEMLWDCCSIYWCQIIRHCPDVHFRWPWFYVWYSMIIGYANLEADICESVFHIYTVYIYIYIYIYIDVCNVMQHKLKTCRHQDIHIFSSIANECFDRQIFARWPLQNPWRIYQSLERPAPIISVAGQATWAMEISPCLTVNHRNCMNLSRKVAPEGLPWVLLYEVKGRAASPVTWFIRRLLVILGPPPPPKSLRRTLRADPKHCNLQYFCSFRIKKPHFATWWNLRKYQCFC